MRRVLPFLALTGLNPAAAAAANSGFSFKLDGAAGLASDLGARAVNEWDLIANIDGPTDVNRAMDAGHGSDCSPPPVSHHVVTLADSAFLCKGHTMTAIYGGGDAFVSYGAHPADLLHPSRCFRTSDLGGRVAPDEGSVTP